MTRSRAAGLFGRQVFLVPCVVESEQTEESLHLHAIPEGVRLYPGDTVRVIDPPPPPPFGERHRCERMAEVRRAGMMRRWLTRIGGVLSLSELYEVGFEPKDHS